MREYVVVQCLGSRNLKITKQTTNTGHCKLEPQQLIERKLIANCFDDQLSVLVIFQA